MSVLLSELRCRVSRVVSFTDHRFFARAINAPSTGNTYEAWLAAAKALGSNEKPVRYSLVSSGF